MSGTFICPGTCGFAKVIAFELSNGACSSITRGEKESKTKYQARLKQEQFAEFNRIYTVGIDSSSSGDIKSICFQQFHKKLPGLREKIIKWNGRKLHEKEKFLETFSLKAWQQMSESKRREHCFTNCKGCTVRFCEIQAYFPVKSSFLIGKAMQNPVFTATKVNPTPQVKPLQRDIKNTAKAIYDKVDPLFQKQFGTSFAEALSKVPAIDLQYNTPNQLRNKRRQLYRKNKENIEKQMEETAFLR